LYPNRSHWSKGRNVVIYLKSILKLHTELTTYFTMLLTFLLKVLLVEIADHLETT